MIKWIGHLKTINHHKRLVMHNCFRVGLYKQGLLHDLSKYSPVEFRAGAKYFVGTRSPNELERLDVGYSAAWLHHKGRNKHHLEYWIDYSPTGDHRLCGMEMPVNYVVEMFCDRVAASKTYLGAKYTDASPWLYYEHSRDQYLLHPRTRALLEDMLLTLFDEGEEPTFAHIRRDILHNEPGRKRRKAAAAADKHT